MPLTDTSPTPQLSVIIPARNEEISLGACLESLIGQKGVGFEIIVVNDHSTDRTREIAASSRKVRVIDVGALPKSWTGKNNAVSTGARHATAQWLLFTDADTIHTPGSLSRALAEAKDSKADVLSYSPEQIAVTFWEKAILPVVFAELARQFPPSKVSDPSSPEAAANGQFILIRREAYDAIGGHAAVASEILEDVALARRVKAAGYKLRFRYSESVRTRMYRNFDQLREGWTKNLALLFPGPGRLAAQILGLWTLIWVASLVGLKTSLAPVGWAASAILFAILFLRVRRSNFSAQKTFLALVFGVPMFAYLLVRSRRAHRKGTVGWKGRTYEATNSSTAPRNTTPSGNSLMKTPQALLLLTLALCLTSLRAQTADDQLHFTNTEIQAGHSMGPLKINDSGETAMQLFPKKDIDQQWEDP